MIDQKTQCDDDRLLQMLRQESDSSDRVEILDHVEGCAYCQQRLDELAADESDWQKTIEVLSTLASDTLKGEAVLNPSRFQLQQHAWTESMAQKLLLPPTHPEMLGRIGRYDVERLIGSGGMGVVFKAYDTELNRPVAVKLLTPHLARSGSARNRFAREARAAAAVVDDHVVPIHNVETDDEHPFLVMKYIAGGSLQQRLDRDGPLDVCEVLRIGMQTGKGLAAAHAQGLIHRDVKPSNILLDEGVDRALLTDFGLARATDDASLTRSGFQPGTPHYMSPEQVRGAAIDTRSDLFGLGCVLYALGTGHPPFRSETSYSVLRRITDDTPRSIRETNPGVPVWLEQIVMKLLAKSPDDRFDSAEQVAELLEDCLAHVQNPTTKLLPAPVAELAKSAGYQNRTSKSSGGFRVPPIGTLIAAAAFAILLIFAGVLIVLELNKGTLTIECDADDVPIRVMRGEEVVKELKISQGSESTRISAGNYVVEVTGKFSGISVESGGKVSLERRGSAVVRITSDESPVRSETEAEPQPDLADLQLEGEKMLGKFGPQDAKLQELDRQNAAENSKRAVTFQAIIFDTDDELTAEFPAGTFQHAYTKEFEKRLKHLVEDKKATIVSRPQIRSQIGKTGMVKIGRRILVVSPETGDRLERDFGETLQITPREVDGKLVLDVKFETEYPRNPNNEKTADLVLASGFSFRVPMKNFTGRGGLIGPFELANKQRHIIHLIAQDNEKYADKTASRNTKLATEVDLPGETPTPTPVLPNQKMKVKRAKHTFTLSKVIGSMQVQGMPGLSGPAFISQDEKGNLIITGAPEDVAIVKREIARLSAQTRSALPIVKSFPLQNARGSHIQERVQTIYDESYSQITGPANITATDNPNSLVVVVGSQEAFNAVESLVKVLDVAAVEGATKDFRTFGLKFISATDAATRLRTFFEQTTLAQDDIRIPAAAVEVISDFRSNQVTVKGRATILNMAADFLRTIDVASVDGGAVRTNPVDFVLGETNLANGDLIEIQTVTTSGTGFEVGATVTVKGSYTLNSEDVASLAFYSTQLPGEKPTPTLVQPSQKMKVKRGKHTFTLSKVIGSLGSPHVSFYHPTTGQGMGGVYFSQKERGGIRKVTDKMPAQAPDSYRPFVGKTTK